MDAFPKFSVIIPVKNEAGILGRCLESLEKLDYDKGRLEVILADGLSTDDTRQIAQRFNVRLVVNDKQVVVSGRNRGFAAAKGDIIVFTDADCTFDPGWLKNSIKYFSDDKVGGVGGITLMPKESTDFEKAVELLFYLTDIFQATAHRGSVSLPREVKDIPGCNAMYRRSALERVMPVDESLLTAEDVWMNFCIREAGYKLIAARDVTLWHYRRNSPKRFLRQIYRFAVGRLQVGKKNLSLLRPLHILFGIGIPIFFGSGIYFYLSANGILFLKLNLFIFGLLAVLAIIKSRSLMVALNFLLVAILFFFYWSAGFLRELFFPLKDISGR